MEVVLLMYGFAMIQVYNFVDFIREQLLKASKCYDGWIN